MNTTLAKVLQPVIVYGLGIICPAVPGVIAFAVMTPAVGAPKAVAPKVRVARSVLPAVERMVFAFTGWGPE